MVQKRSTLPSKVQDPMISLACLLTETSDTISNAIELELAQYGVNYTEARILYMLAKKDRPVTYHEISRWIMRELNSVSVLIRKLDKEGLISKVYQPGSRKTFITLSEKGRELFYHRITEKSIYMIFETLGENERTEFEAHLNFLRDKARSLLGLDFKPPFM